MNKLLLSFLMMTFSIPAFSADIELGKKAYAQNCATCHGRNGEKKALGRSKILKEMDKSSFVGALQLRQQGLISGGGNAAKKRLTAEQMENIAAFLALE